MSLSTDWFNLKALDKYVFRMEDKGMAVQIDPLFSEISVIEVSGFIFYKSQNRLDR